jgi:hypothetical protein
MIPDIYIPTETVTTSSPSWQSAISPAKPMTNDHIYYFLPYWDDKPCMHVRSVWPDYRRRMYNSNIIARIVDKLVSNITKLRNTVLFSEFSIVFHKVFKTTAHFYLITFGSTDTVYQLQHDCCYVLHYTKIKFLFVFLIVN